MRVYRERRRGGTCCSPGCWLGSGCSGSGSEDEGASRRGVVSWPLGPLWAAAPCTATPVGSPPNLHPNYASQPALTQSAARNPAPTHPPTPAIQPVRHLPPTQTHLPVGPWPGPPPAGGACDPGSQPTAPGGRVGGWVEVGGATHRGEEGHVAAQGVVPLFGRLLQRLSQETGKETVGEVGGWPACGAERLTRGGRLPKAPTHQPPTQPMLFSGEARSAQMHPIPL